MGSLAGAYRFGQALIATRFFGYYDLTSRARRGMVAVVDGAGQPVNRLTGHFWENGLKDVGGMDDKGDVVRARNTRLKPRKSRGG